VQKFAKSLILLLYIDCEPPLLPLQLLLGQYVEPPGKRTRTSPYIIPELVHVVAACEEKLPFVFLGEQVTDYLHTICDIAYI